MIIRSFHTTTSVDWIFITVLARGGERGMWGMGVGVHDVYICRVGVCTEKEVRESTVAELVSTWCAKFRVTGSIPVGKPL